MNYKHILITGGAGFVGSNLAIKFNDYYPQLKITCLDNLMRRGSELNLTRLKKSGIDFLHGDVRNKEDLDIKEVDLIIECSAEPSVMAGVAGSPEYLLNTNINGAINCFELARKNGSDIIFLSTSRVYPVSYLNRLEIEESDTRFVLKKQQPYKGASEKGVSEDFPLDAPRTLYGTTKLAAEYLLAEYLENYKIKGVVNRCGLLTGPWQMGKVDQGVIVYWLAAHLFQKPLSYFGFGGKGKQVRDMLHVDDLFTLLDMEINHLDEISGKVYNIGGGLEVSCSLLELTGLCREISGKKVAVKSILKDRPGDIKIYLSDCSKIKHDLGWKPKKTCPETITDIYKWMIDNKDSLKNILT